MRSLSFERALSAEIFRLGALDLGFDGDFFLVDGDVHVDTLGFSLALGRFVATFDDFSNRNQLI